MDFAESADDVFAANDIETIVVEVPEWDLKLRIATMRSDHWEQYQRSLIDVEGKEVSMVNMLAKFISFCAVNADGDLMFTPDQVELLGKKSYRALDRVRREAEKFNRIGIAGLEDAAKN